MLAGEAAQAAAALVALGDSVLEPARVDRGVDGRGADVGVASELADDRGVSAGVGEVRAEGVAQDVGGAPVVGQAGGVGVASDDPRDVAGGQWAGLAGAGEREQQVLSGGDGAGADPGGEGVERVGVERDGAGAAALGVAHGHPPACRSGGRPTQARVAGAAALVDVADEQRGGFGAP